MTPAAAVRLCAAAKLHVLAVALVGRQICVTVAAFDVMPETVIRRLGVPVTLSFGDGTGGLELWFMGDRA